MDAKSKIETDIRGTMFPDGSSVNTIATFKDGKNTGIIMYVVKRNRVITNKVNYYGISQYGNSGGICG